MPTDTASYVEYLGGMWFTGNTDIPAHAVASQVRSAEKTNGQVTVGRNQGRVSVTIIQYGQTRIYRQAGC